MVESIHSPIQLDFFAKNFDELYECKFWLPHLKTLFKNVYQKEMQLVFCAHGQSDKGYGNPLLHPYSSQDRCLIYGSLLKEMLDDLNIQANCQFTGNYRLEFYLKHKKFYDTLITKEVLNRFPKQQFTLLYAPTWKDADGSSSFFRSISALCNHLPDHLNLIVKVHPLLEQRDPAQYYRLSHLIEQKPNRILVDSFPPIYPLLAHVDAYLGDYSSVGYDYLFFQKPMFFLLQEKLPRGRLHECGKVLSNMQDLFLNITKNPYREKQAALYRKAFYY